MIITIYCLDSATVQLWRFSDPILGERKIPAFNDATKDKVLIDPSSVFEVNISKKTINVVVNNQQFELGGSITYLVS